MRRLVRRPVEAVGAGAGAATMKGRGLLGIRPLGVSTPFLAITEPARPPRSSTDSDGGRRLGYASGNRGSAEVGSKLFTCCGVQHGLERGFRTLRCKRFAVVIEGIDEVGVLGDTARQQRLDPQRFPRIARCQQQARGLVEPRLGHFEGLAVVILALQYAAPRSEDERRDAMVCTAL